MADAAVSINTRILKFLVFTIVLCGIIGVLIYLADLQSGQVLTTVSPPVVPTLSTQKATFEPIFPQTESTPHSFKETTSLNNDVTSAAETTTSSMQEEATSEIAKTTITLSGVTFQEVLSKSRVECEAACDESETCHFYSVLNGQDCYLGTFGQFGQIQMEILIDVTFKAGAMEKYVESHFHLVPSKIGLVRPNVLETSSLSVFLECSVACAQKYFAHEINSSLTIYDIPCTFFYISEGNCFMGSMEKVDMESIIDPDETPIEVYLRKDDEENPNDLGFLQSETKIQDLSLININVPFEVGQSFCLAVSYLTSSDFAVFENGQCSTGMYDSIDANQVSSLNKTQVFLSPRGQSLTKYRTIEFLQRSFEDNAQWTRYENVHSLNLCAGLCRLKGSCMIFYLEMNDCLTGPKAKRPLISDGLGDLNRTIFVNEEIISTLITPQDMVKGSPTTTFTPFLQWPHMGLEADSALACQFACLMTPHENCSLAVYIAQESPSCHFFTGLPMTMSSSAQMASEAATNVFYRLSPDTNFNAQFQAYTEDMNLYDFPSWTCHPSAAFFVGNGMCDDVSNTAECGWDNFECCGVQMQRGACTDCTCHTSGKRPLDVDVDLSCDLNYSGLQYLDDGVCTQNINYEKCGFYDAGDCCDPRSTNDYHLAQIVVFNTQCHLLGEKMPKNVTKTLKRFLLGVEDGVKDPDADAQYPYFKQLSINSPLLLTAFTSGKLAQYNTDLSRKNFYPTMLDRNLRFQMYSKDE